MSNYHQPRYTANRNAIIRTRIDAKGQLRTETARRDEGFDVAVSTDERNNKTRVFIDMDGRPSGFGLFGETLELNGHQARTLYRALQKHYENVG